MSETVFALKIENANEDGLVNLKKNIAEIKSLNVFDSDEVFVVYPLNSDLTEAISTGGFDLGLESTTLEIVDFNVGDSDYHIDENLIDKLSSDSDVQLNENAFGLRDLDSVSNYITENEVEPESKGRDSPTATSTETEEDIDEQKEPESDDDNSETDDFDNSDLEEEFKNSEENSTQDSSKVSTEDSDYSSDNEDISDEEISVSNNQVTSNGSDSDLGNSTEKPNNETNKGINDSSITDVDTFFNDAFSDESNNSGSSMIDIAENMFDSQEQTTIPSIDPDMPDSLKEVILKAQNNIYRKKDEIISNISQRLVKSEKNEYQKLENNQFKEAKTAHDKALQDIDSNIASQKTDSERKRQKDYDVQKSDFVQAQISKLKHEYDLEHSNELRELISDDYKIILEEANLSKDQENSQYDEYLVTSKKSSFQSVLRTIDISQDIQAFRKYVQKQNNIINSFSNEFKKYKESKQKELDRKDSELELLKKTSEEQNNLKIQQIKADNAIELSRLSDSLSETKKELDKQRQKNEILTDLHINKPEPVRKEAIDKETAVSSKPQEVTGEIISKKEKTNSGINWWIPTSVVTGVIALVAILFGMFMALRPVTAPQSIVQPQTQQVQSSNSDKSSTPSKTLKKGDSFVYTKADGTQVKVIVDSSNSGHYIDDDGNSQTVTF